MIVKKQENFTSDERPPRIDQPRQETSGSRTDSARGSQRNGQIGPDGNSNQISTAKPRHKSPQQRKGKRSPGTGSAQTEDQQTTEQRICDQNRERINDGINDGISDRETPGNRQGTEGRTDRNGQRNNQGKRQPTDPERSPNRISPGQIELNSSDSRRADINHLPLIPYRQVNTIQHRGTTMKCLRCRNTMTRKKNTDHRYYYECPSCHAVVGRAVMREHTVKDDGEVQGTSVRQSSDSGDTAG